MKKVQVEYNLYRFKQLSKDAKKKVLDVYRYYFVEDEWWIHDDIYKEIARDMGIDINMNTICFNLDGGYRELYFRDISICCEKTLCKKAKVKYRADGMLKISTYYHNTGENIIENVDVIIEYYTEEELTKLNGVLANLFDKFIDMLRDDYGALTSDEYIIQWIEDNDSWFTIDGKMFNEQPGKIIKRR